MVRRAVADQLRETDDLDWKQALPVAPVDGRWNEFAKDVAAMANTRGGLLIYGVSDDVREIGIDPSHVNEQQLGQWVRNHAQPYVHGLSFTPVSDGPVSFLIVDVPASAWAPHSVYGTAAKDKDQMASVVPYRDGPHTDWMAEHQLARAYADRFARQDAAEIELRQRLEFVSDMVVGSGELRAAWVVVAARPQRPLPRNVSAPTREQIQATLSASLAKASTLHGMRFGLVPVLRDLQPTVRVGLRRWVVHESNGRPLLLELHHDGTAILAADMSWKAFNAQGVSPPLAVRCGAITGAVFDAVALATELRRTLVGDSALDVTAIVTAGPDNTAPFVPVTSRNGVVEVPEHARRPSRMLPVSTTLPQAVDRDGLIAVAEELSEGLLNQFGLTS
ncbi:ATP-binding protein [Embleya sp. NBC_00896]|uniref:AlbA family DNA-binding domain-containing protein n=1 Tax=Embleya sp. NBC_00896 TaxID=2975961 RepID=UPI002F91827D|nr:ATP-binding protein [Embleya sp. NBC_00896]